MSQRICKVVRRHDTSVASSYGYPRWIYRTVECLPHQSGYLSERGVRLLWESEFVTYQGGPKDRRQRAAAKAISDRGNRALAVGLDPATPEGIIADCECELS